MASRPNTNTNNNLHQTLVTAPPSSRAARKCVQSPGTFHLAYITLPRCICYVAEDLSNGAQIPIVPVTNIFPLCSQVVEVL
ncbi:uncharacterized protein RHO25_002335 [Cercospora beticola]|uniref:Uncharacterized protein n=1 Tax=Cercospora beticola TaxID=122368 RepID=A0ABZ0NE28_CERBT|nr:hypothetical protein RHO25_002335 [Cercospora beticola]CAK1358924.1 unnamed protein product [Cercospora beticola]